MGGGFPEISKMEAGGTEAWGSAGLGELWPSRRQQGQGWAWAKPAPQEQRLLLGPGGTSSFRLETCLSTSMPGLGESETVALGPGALLTAGHVFDIKAPCRLIRPLPSEEPEQWQGRGGGALHGPRVTELRVHRTESRQPTKGWGTADPRGYLPCPLAGLLILPVRRAALVAKGK